MAMKSKLLLVLSCVCLASLSSFVLGQAKADNRKANSSAIDEVYADYATSYSELPKGKESDYTEHPCGLKLGEVETQAFVRVCKRYREKIKCTDPRTEADMARCGFRTVPTTPEDLKVINELHEKFHGKSVREANSSLKKAI
jgi:hypothetical protein